MAISNTNGTVSGLSETSDLEAITDFSMTMLCRLRQGHTSGEMPLWELTASGKRLELRMNVAAPGTNAVFILDNNGGWESLDALVHPLNTWVGIGVSCGGTGATDLTIALALDAVSAPVVVSRQITPTWTPTLLRLLHSSLAWGIHGDIQNVKYGENALTASQLRDECWAAAVMHPSSWTPIVTEMIDGDLTAQAEGFTQVSSGNLAVVPGPLVSSGGGTPPAIVISAATISGDDLSTNGTFTTEAGNQSIVIELLSGTSVIASSNAQVSGGNWSAAFNDIPAGTYSLRARVIDANGTDVETYGSSLVFIGLSGEDELPSTYATTSLVAAPATASVPAGSTVRLRCLNQAGTAVAAIVSVADTSKATAPALADADGYVDVTGVAQGSTTVTFTVVNLAGVTLTAQVALTVGAPSVSTVTVTPATAALRINQTQQFTSVITGGGSTTWTVESGGGSIDSNGLYTAPSTATTAVIRGAKTGDLSNYDESTVTVTAEAQSGIGGSFLGNADLSVAPGQSFSWRIRVEVDGVAYQGAVVTPVAAPSDRLSITTPLATAADGTTTVTARVMDGIATGVTVDVAFGIVAGDLSMSLAAVVSIGDAPYGYVLLRGRYYPRPYEQKS